MYAAIFSLRVLNSLNTCFTTSRESQNMSTTDISKFHANLRPVMRPSYYDSLLVVGNLNFTTCHTMKPSGLVRITPAPPSHEVDDPSVNKVQALSSKLDTILPIFELENAH